MGARRRSTILTSAYRAGLAFSGIAIAALALSSAAGAHSTALDAMNNLAPFLLAAAVSCGALAALPLRRPVSLRLCAAMSAPAALWFAIMTGPELAKHARLGLIAPVAHAGQAVPNVRIITFNSRLHLSAAAETAAGVAAFDADILVLQEFSDADVAALQAARPEYATWVRCAASPYCHVQILSRRPALEANRLALAYRESRTDENWARHLRMADAVFPVDPAAPEGARFHLVGVHLRRGDTDDLQAIQAQELVEALAGADSHGLVIAGDYNLTPWTHRLQSLERRLGVRRATGVFPTWPTPSRSIRGFRIDAIAPIDHVHAGPAWRPAGAERLADIGSDHYPLAATLVWTGG